MTAYQEVKDQSTEEYFNGNQFSIDAFNKKYRLNNTETYVQTIKRVCDCISSVEETEELQKYWSERWFDEIYNDWWHPSGSIMQGANSGKKISNSNCTTISLGTGRDNEEWDNLESIIRNTSYTVAKAAAYRQGIGVDFSRLRPSGSSILNSANESTGPTHWMKLIDSLGYYVGQKGRIPAMLFSLICTHPDIEKFISLKENNTYIQNANISVQCTNDLYKAVKKDKDLTLKFTIPETKKGQKVYVDCHSATMDCLQDDQGYYYIATHNKEKEKITKTINARKLLELIAQHMWVNGEPGIQNIDIARHYSNSDYVNDPKDIYCSKIVSSNACCITGETKIFTNLGYIDIATLYKNYQLRGDCDGIKALSFNTKKEIFQFKNILHVFQQRTDFTVQLYIENIQDYSKTAIDGDYLECSEDHPILIKTSTNEYKYIPAVELTEKHDIVSLYGISKLAHISYQNGRPKKKLYDIEVEKNHNFITDAHIVIKNSEQYLSRDSLCVLSSINVGKFSTQPQQYEEELDKIGHSINRFLDNVNSVELKDKTYATPFQRISIEKLRRTGAGLTNIAEWLLKQGCEYGEQDSNDKIGHFVERYNYYLYKSSIELGKEKGNFGLFNRKKLEQSPFIQHMIDLGLKFTHLRNITCSSIAPTGTLSLMFRRYIMSYGIEPSFGIYYWKRTRISGEYKYYFCVPQIVLDIFNEHDYPIPIKSNTIEDTFDGKRGIKIVNYIEEHRNEIDINFKKPSEISPIDKLELMSKLLPNIDSSISTTYMMNPDGKWQDIYDLILLAYDKELKSITALPDKKIYGIVSHIPFKDLAESLINQGLSIHKQNFTEEEFNELYGHSKTLTRETRPRELRCNVHHTTIKGQKYFVLVGLWSDGSAYEVFTGKNGFLSPNIKSGRIVRKKKNFYKAIFDEDDTELSPVTAAMNDMEEILSRMISMSLRSGANMHLVVDQLEKISSSGMHDYAKCLARALKHYIPDHSKIEGEICPECGGDLIRMDGCKTCILCEHTKCL